jgi:DNA polymerase-3 subunit delta'
MRRESANAMLKMLEEPPPNTHIILLTEKLHTVLPTIVSRCQIVRFGALPLEQIREALSGEFGIAAGEEEVDSALESAMGSLGRALELAENPSGEGKQRGRQLWNACLDNDWLSAARVIDEAASVDGIEQREQMVLQLMFLARNEVVPEKERREKYFTEMNSTVKSNFPAEVAKAEAVIACCREAVAGLRAYGNASLVLVCLAQSMMELLHGKEYQTG